MKSNPSQAADACAEELKTRFGLSDFTIEAIMKAATAMSNEAEDFLQALALVEAGQRDLTQMHEVYHDIDLALATCFLRLVEDCASSCPLHGDKYATL